MNIVLIGFRGAGKSSVAKILADRLKRTVVSTDGEIVARTRLSIPEVVKRFGWDYFRDLESEVCRDLAGRDGLIIDTGGGAILRSQNVDVLKQNGVLFWLTAEVRTIEQRIAGDDQRPSLTGSQSFLDEIEEVLRERRPKYQAAADYCIPTDNRTPAEVADVILTTLSHPLQY